MWCSDVEIIYKIVEQLLLLYLEDSENGKKREEKNPLNSSNRRENKHISKNKNAYVRICVYLFTYKATHTCICVFI